MLWTLVKSILRLGTFCSACSVAILFLKVEAAGGVDHLRFRDADVVATAGSAVDVGSTTAGVGSFFTGRLAIS